ncbi:MAG: SDR family oxidoreductase [Betaproteobacteria bacterium]|nr:SDR family oxidoreductase [Betaproteobacteria bacterium]
MALVIGANGGIGSALVSALVADGCFVDVIGLSRSSTPRLDLTIPSSIEDAAAQVVSGGGDLRLVIDATGVLEGDGCVAEKTYRQLDALGMARAFAINAIGPALLMKHFLPLLPRAGKSVFASLSARVGSIGDNHLGGWYSYRASKAALNQIVHTAAIELGRTRPGAICVAIHPGTVATRLSQRFAKSGLEVQPPELAAMRMLTVIDTLTPASSGGFLDQRGQVIAW